MSIRALPLWEGQHWSMTHVTRRFPRKHRLGPQNGSRSLEPEKLLKIVSCATIKETENAERNNGGGPGGLGRWPPISTWINEPACFSYLKKV